MFKHKLPFLIVTVIDSYLMNVFFHISVQRCCTPNYLKERSHLSSPISLLMSSIGICNTLEFFTIDNFREKLK